LADFGRLWQTLVNFGCTGYNRARLGWQILATISDECVILRDGRHNLRVGRLWQTLVNFGCTGYNRAHLGWQILATISDE
jgi:hypothetical protein